MTKEEIVKIVNEAVNEAFERTGKGTSVKMSIIDRIYNKMFSIEKPPQHFLQDEIVRFTTPQIATYQWNPYKLIACRVDFPKTRISIYEYAATMAGQLDPMPKWTSIEKDGRLSFWGKEPFDQICVLKTTFRLDKPEKWRLE